MVIEPTFVDNLYKTYFPTRYNHIILNESEKEYLATKSSIKVGYCGDMNPYIYKKDGVVDGLIPAYLKTIFDIVADVDIQYYGYDDYPKANNDLKTGVIDIWFAASANNTSTYAIYTDTYLDFDMDFIVNPDSYSKDYDDMNVGIYIFDVGYVKTDKKLNYYYSMEDMLKDVSSGKLDGAFCAYHFYQYATYTLRINNLINKETFATYGVSFGLNSSSTYLHSILNKGIHYVTYNELDNLKVTYLTIYKYTNLFTDWLNYNIAIIIPSLVAIFVICMAVIIYIVIVNKDRKKKNKKLTDLVTLDLLTGLYNKDESAKITEEYVKNNTPFSLFIIDLDNFKSINDTYGHEAGDEALVEFGKILKSLTDYRSKAFRFGGDEFIFIVEGATKEENIELSKQILGKMKTIHISFKIFKPTCSIGVAMFPEAGTTVKELLYNADLALYSVKAAGKNNYEIFDGGRKYPNSIRMEVIEQIKKSIENNDVYMLFQPQIDVKTNKVVGYEALMRIRNFQFGPADFIALAEKSGLIVTLGRIALVQAIEFLGMLKENGLEYVGVSINYSALQINDSGYFDLLVGEAKKHNVRLEDITIEFTESLFFESTPNIQTFVDEIKKNKIKLDLDDFGSGNSSINNLTKFKFNTIKFDKDLINNKTLFPTISNLIDFVHDIGYKVLAEGVETKEQFDIMKEKHCDLIQGYYFAKPMDKYDAIEYGKKFNNVK